MYALEDSLGVYEIHCAYNSVANGICLLDKKQFRVIQENIHASKSLWKIYTLNVEKM